MGAKVIVDKTNRIVPLSTVGSLTPNSFVVSATNIAAYGALVMGNYKGALAFLDLNKLGNEPLVHAEQQYIAGILNGREEGYDLRTITIPAASPVGTALTGSLIVPAGPPLYINAVQMFVPFDVTAGVTVNWNCSLWTDRAATPSAFGQPFRTLAQALAATNCPAGGPNLNNLDEFGPVATAWAVTNKVPLLRLTPGAVITFTVLTDTAISTAAMACTLSLHGAVGKVLVE